MSHRLRFLRGALLGLIATFIAVGPLVARGLGTPWPPTWGITASWPTRVCVADFRTADGRAADRALFDRGGSGLWRLRSEHAVRRAVREACGKRGAGDELYGDVRCGTEGRWDRVFEPDVPLCQEGR